MATIRFAHVVCTALLALLATPATSLAQAAHPEAGAPATAVSPLTVQGTTRAELQKQAQAFVESYAQPTRKLDLLARWNGLPACVAVTGLAPEQAAAVKTRIETVAKAVKAPVGPAKCKPNIEIVFTNEPQRYVDAAAAKTPAILGAGGDRTVTRPIQAWYATADDGIAPDGLGPVNDRPPPRSSNEFEDRLHERIGDVSIKVTRESEAGRRCVDDGVAKHETSMAPEPFTPNPVSVGSPSYRVDLPCLHSLFLNALIIVDVAHMGDVSVDLTADYLALVALSQPKPRALDGCLSLPSVLDLYAVNCPGREPPTGLTPADRAYLAGLYAADVSQVQFKQSAQSEIAGRMVKTMASDKAAAR